MAEEQKDLTEQEKPVKLLDKLLGKLMSRKLTVWLTATIFMAVGKIDSENWVTVCLLFLGAQGLADIAATWKHGHKH